MRTLETVLEDALSLPPAARSQLIRHLIDSLDDPAADEPDAEDAWAEVIARRIADLDAGRASTVDGKAAIAAAREDLARRRKNG
jgi:putative addiction module component (TIGR02574 family)